VKIADREFGHHWLLTVKFGRVACFSRPPLRPPEELAANNMH